MNSFIEGFIAGIAYVVPIGAQNIFLIHASLKLGAPRHLQVALYVFLADLSLATICFFGLGEILTSSFFLRIILTILGALILFMMGYKLITTRDQPVISTEEKQSDLSYFKKALLVTYANPQAIIDGALIYGALRATYTNNSLIHFFSGNVTASIIWFGGISSLVAIFQNAKIVSKIKWIERVCGGLMIGLGVKVIWSAFKKVYEIN